MLLGKSKWSAAWFHYIWIALKLAYNRNKLFKTLHYWSKRFTSRKNLKKASKFYRKINYYFQLSIFSNLGATSNFIHNRVSYIHNLEFLLCIWGAIIKNKTPSTCYRRTRNPYLRRSNFIIRYNQKQPPRGVPRQRCSENMQQIYRRTHPCRSAMELRQLYWNGTSAWMSSC